MKNFIKSLYFKMLNLLHRPFVKQSANDPYHAIYAQFIALGEKVPGASVLEIGSRNTSGVARGLPFPNRLEYVGFDFLAGDGVDIVGDAHKLSTYCRPEHFDLVYSISVFEHLLFPWKVVLEINKVMKPGGYVFVATHPVWPGHELPWDFWRFPENGFKALFNQHTGFEIIALSEGLPGRYYSLDDGAPTRTNYLYVMNQGVSMIARKTGPYRSDLLKWDIEVSDVLDTIYPVNQSGGRRN